MPDISIHCWKDEKDSNLYRLEFGAIGKTESFAFDITVWSLEKMINAIAEFANTSACGDYKQLCVDLTEDGEDDRKLPFEQPA
jgi:hypothetical protein